MGVTIRNRNSGGVIRSKLAASAKNRRTRSSGSSRDVEAPKVCSMDDSQRGTKCYVACVFRDSRRCFPGCPTIGGSRRRRGRTPGFSLRRRRGADGDSPPRFRQTRNRLFTLLYKNPPPGRHQPMVIPRAARRDQTTRVDGSTSSFACDTGKRSRRQTGSYSI